MDTHISVWTSPGVFADLVDHFPANVQGCGGEVGSFRVDNLWFYGDLPDDSPEKPGHQGQGEPARRVYLDTDCDQLGLYAGKGWRTIWFNPAGLISPDFVPVHDGELLKLDDLNQIPDLLAKPTLKTCLDWMDAWGVPENIRRHTQRVARLAYGLGVLLRGQGQPVDPILAHRGGLLHDLDKLHTLDANQRHGAAAAKFLQDQGHPDLAEIVRGHILQSALEERTDLQTWEARLVFFCDKLVEEDRIVPFDVRFTALKERYPGFRGIMDRAEPVVWALNDQICSILSIPNHKNLISRLQIL